MRETTALRNASKRDEFEQPGAACPVDDVHQHVELGDRPGRRLLVHEGGTLERLKEAAGSSVQGYPPSSRQCLGTELFEARLAYFHVFNTGGTASIAHTQAGYTRRSICNGGW